MSDARIMKFQTAKAFYDFCVKHDACEEGLAEISGLTWTSGRFAIRTAKRATTPMGA